MTSTQKTGSTPRVEISERLAQLQDERTKGQQMLARAESEAAELRATLLRIEGAIQVLEELTSDPTPSED